MIFSVLILLTFTTSIISFLSIKIFKLKKIKSDILLCEKSLLKIILCLYLIYLIVSFYNDLPSLEYFFLPLFMIVNSMLSLFIYWERYKSLYNPFYVVNNYIGRKSNLIYQEILMVILIISVVITELFKDDLEMDLILFGIFLIVNIFSSLIIYLNRRIVLKISPECNKYISRIINIEIFENVFHYCFIIFITVFQIKLHEKSSDDLFVILTYVTGFIWIILEELFNMGKIYNSDFYYFVLGLTQIGWLYRINGNEIYNKPLIPRETSHSVINNEYSLQFLHEKRNIYIESYNLSLCDLTIHSIFNSLYIAYKKYNANYSYNQNSNLLDDSISKYDYNYTLEKNGERNDFIDDQNNPLLIYSSNLRVEIHFFFQNKFFEYIRFKDIDIASLKGSIISNTLKDTSILVKNVKDNVRENGLIIKSMDNQYHIQIIDDNFFKDKSKTIKQFLKHNLKNKNSFLPYILGAFCMKINDMKPVYLLFLKSKFVTEVPNEYYNWWQMMKFSKDKEKVIGSSKYKKVDDYIKNVETDNVLSNENQMSLTNYNQFKDNLMNDMKFFKKQRIIDFSFVVVIYEIGVFLSENVTNEEEKVIQKKSIHFKRISLVSRNISAIKAIRENSLNKFGNNDSIFVNNLGNREDLLTDNSNKLDLSAIIPNEDGYDGDMNNSKYVIFFAFDDCFSDFQFIENRQYYIDFYNNIICKFDSLKFMPTETKK
jgi:hypothetical protein